MRSLKTWSTVAVLAGLGTGCARVHVAPPGKAVHLTVFVYPAPKAPNGCASVTIPQYVYVKQGDDIVWDVKNDTCPDAGEVTIRIESSVVEITENKKSEKKGKVKGSTGVYPYKTALGSGFVEDPRIEIW